MTRARFAMAVGLAVALVVGGIAMERSLGVRGPDLAQVPIPAASSGAWFCPHGGGEGWETWVVIANPSESPTQLSLFTAGGAPEMESGVLEPGTHLYVPVEAESLSAGTVVEFFGGDAVASMVVSRPDGGGVAAEPCTDRATDRWYVADGTADIEGEGVSVVVLNPTAAEAVVDIVVTTEREVVRPGPLQGLVLPPGRAKGFDLNRFALGAATVGARVTAAVGRVSVAGLGSNEGGLRATIGAPELRTRWFLPGAGDGARSELVIAAPSVEVPFQARAQGTEGQIPVLEQDTVQAGAIRTFAVATEGGALVAEAEGAAGFVAARRSSYRGVGVEAPEEPAPTETPAPQATPTPSPTETTGPSPSPSPSPTARADRGGDRDRQQREERPPDEAVDRASTSGASAVATHWVVPPATGPQGGPSVLQIQSPGRRSVTAAVTLFGEDGPVRAEGLGEVEIRAGRVANIRLDEVAEEPVTAVVRATGGVVAAQASVDPQAYAFSLGSPASSVLTESTSGISS